MRRFASVIVFCLLPVGMYGQQKPLDAEWGRLIDGHKIAAATKLCTAWSQTAVLAKRIEAEKCLANVALAGGSVMQLQGNEIGGGTLSGGYTPAAIDEALKHLNHGIDLAPQDLSIHMGRLHVLEVSGRYDAMLQALEQSIAIYKGPGTPGCWLAYAPELSAAGEPSVGLRWSQLLEKYYPDNSDVVGNVGGFLNSLGKYQEGLAYVRRAQQMHPTDPIDTWNLGWSLMHLDQNDEADKWMSTSLKLDPSEDQMPYRKCLYGKFLVEKKNLPVAGCALVLAGCDDDDKAKLPQCVSKKPAS